MQVPAQLLVVVPQLLADCQLPPVPLLFLLLPLLDNTILLLLLLLVLLLLLSLTCFCSWSWWWCIVTVCSQQHQTHTEAKFSSATHLGLAS
jgi:hypothetical protein